MNLDEKIYKKKYLKYKAKYLELKGGADHSGIWNKEGIYVGSIISDFFSKKRNGNGKMTYIDNSVYEGNWVNDKREGKGKMTYADKSIYDGDWKDDKRTGKGKMSYADNSIYDGDWVNDKHSGKGKMTYADNSTYDGDWVDDKYNGKGKMTHVDKSTYDGDWKDGKREGIGKYIYSKSEKSGRKYVNQTCYGIGRKRRCHDNYIDTYTLREVIYEGEWKNNMKDGKGKLTGDPEKTSVREGNWKEDKPI